MFLPDEVELRARFEEYINVKEMAAHYKQLEQEMRLEICDKFGDTKIGTNNHEIAGFKLKHIIKVAKKLDQEMVQDYIDEGLLSEEQLAAIKTTYTIKVKEFNSLVSEDADTLNDMITIKPAMPDLDIEQIA